MRGRDEVGHQPVFDEIILVSFLILIRQVIVGDAFLQELGFDFVVIIWDEHMVLIDCRLIVVCIGGDAMLHLEKIIGVAVDIRFRCCGQTDHDRIKVFKDSTVLFENAAVAFVDDNEVKMCRGKHSLAIFCLYIVDGIQHCRVCRKYNSRAAIVLIGAKVAQRHIWQVILKVILCLLDQRGAVCQKQNVGDMLATTQYICQAGCGSGLAGTCGHHQQVLSESKTDLLTYCADCFFLVVAVSDTIVDGNGHQIHALCSAVHELLQIVFAEYAANSALGAALIVPEVGFKTVSGEHHGTATEFAFQTVSV